MVKSLLGKKLGMTQLFDESGSVLPVTVLQVGPCYVIQVKTSDSDECLAVQIGFDEAKKKRVSKPLLGHFAKAGVPPTKLLRDVEPDGDEVPELGQRLGAEVFAETARVDVTGISKGRGFAGVMRRHGFHGMPASHGTSKKHRAPGSIGSGTDPGRVMRGKAMPGHMGVRQVTVHNLDVVRVDTDRNLLLVKGAVPGSKGSYVTVSKPKREGSKS